MTVGRLRPRKRFGVPLEIGAAHPVALDRHHSPPARRRQRDREQPDAGVQVEHRAVGRTASITASSEVRHEESVRLKERLRVPAKAAVRHAPARQQAPASRSPRARQPRPHGFVDPEPRSQPARCQPPAAPALLPRSPSHRRRRPPAPARCHQRSRSTRPTVDARAGAATRTSTADDTDSSAASLTCPVAAASHRACVPSR